MFNLLLLSFNTLIFKDLVNLKPDGKLRKGTGQDGVGVESPFPPQPP